MEKKTKEKKTKQPGFEYLNQYTSKRKGAYLLSIVLAVVGVGCSIAPYYGIYKMAQIILHDEGATFLDYVPWIVFIAFSLLLWDIFHTLSTGVSHKNTFELLSEMRKDTCQKLVDIPMGYALAKPSGVLKATVVEKVDGTEPILAHAVPELTSNVLLPLGIIVYIFILDWRMGLASLATLPLAMVFMGMMMKDYDTNFKKMTAISNRMNSTMVEYINGIEVIKGFGQSAGSYGKFKNAVKENAEFGINWMAKVQRTMAAAFAILPSTLIVVLPLGVLLVKNGSLQADDFILIGLLNTGIFAPIMAAMQFVDALAQVNTSLTELSSIASYKSMERGNKAIDLGKNDISMKDIKFSYETENKEKTLVLDGVNLHIKGGEVTALVGPSGAGKSTIAKIIAGFWDWDEGTLEIGGVNGKEIPLEELNRKLAYVTQDNFLFDETVMDNIRKGNLRATDEEVVEAAKKTGCHDFIMKLENGYQTMVGTGGGHLSGGEKQRLSIARAMLKNAEIIILDEATAYTDPENEAIIQSSISKLIEGKTLIVIAHRLSTIRNSDQIIVVDEGKINSAGSHEELLNKSTLYNKMWEAHMSAKDRDLRKEGK